MKNISKSLLIASSTLLLATSCIDETLPTSGVTEDQLSSSAKATEALLWGFPAVANQFDINGQDLAYDWGHGSILHIRDVMTEDMAIVESSYDWYTAWECNRYIGQDYASTGFVWKHYTTLFQAANNIIRAIDEETASDLQKQYLGVGHAFRAFANLDAARMWEFLPNDKVNSINSYDNDVNGLTIPIVTEDLTEEQARNNPRVSHKEIFDFILSDLDKAEVLIADYKRPAKVMPNLAVVYGLKARLYMWDEQYDKAREYARKAIDESGCTPLTKDEWLNTNTGFNDASSNSWMFAVQAVKENAVVQTGILNWTSWMSNEATYGYASAGPMSMAGVAFYNKINDNDWRKLSWKAPEGTRLESSMVYCNEEIGEGLVDYASVKFRPGSGNTSDYSIGSATAYPLMRVEEMHFIEAEAAAHLNPAEGAEIITDFMRTHRYKQYTCYATEKDAIVEEIVLQKRIELWGEGQSFFDIKRLNLPVTRVYEGTNFGADAQFNTTTRPAWMNFVFVRSEGNNNTAILEWNNPDPSDCYK